MASRVAALFLLGLICVQLSTAQIAMDCCLKVSNVRLNPKNLVSYSIQEAGMGCAIDATVFVNRKNLKLCIVPREGNPWVQNLIKYLEKKRKPQN